MILESKKFPEFNIKPYRRSGRKRKI